MSRRTVSSVLVTVLLVGLISAAALLPVPYVTMSPGPTVNVLDEVEGDRVIEVEGADTYPTDGDLRLTTVSVTSPDAEISLVEALSAWFDGTRAVYPRDVIYPPEQTAEDVQRESSVQMVSSQDTAIAVALRELGYDLPLRTEVLGVTEGSPADGKLEPRDYLLEVNGRTIEDVSQVSDAIQETGVGEPAEFVVRRDGERRTVTVDGRGRARRPRARRGGHRDRHRLRLPLRRRASNLDDNIGGPSAGLIFSLAVYDTLTPGSLTGGDDVAGTGSIDGQGEVGPIGGIQQKMVAAADAGAEVFLVPAANCAAALGADVGEDEIRLVRADTMHEAVESLETYAEDPDAELPSCEDR